jgi:hypothetical protein
MDSKSGKTYFMENEHDIDEMNEKIFRRITIQLQNS